MTWVKTFDYGEAKGRLAEIYQEFKQHPMMRTRVPSVIKCMGLRPEGMQAVFDLNMKITFGASTLGRAREEMIATAVSAVNDCYY